MGMRKKMTVIDFVDSASQQLSAFMDYWQDHADFPEILNEADWWEQFECYVENVMEPDETAM